MDKETLRQDILGLLEGELAALGYELLDVRLFRGGGRLNVRVFLDRAGGIDLEACARASRTVDLLLEEAQAVKEPCVIEVSSPGVRRPLRTPAHFAAAVGSRVELKAGSGGRPVTLRGELVAVDGSGVRLRAMPGDPVPGGEPEEDGAEAEPAAVTAAPAPAAETVAREWAVAWSEIAAANLDPELDIHALINADRRRRHDARREDRRLAREARQARLARRRRPPSE